MKTTRDAVETTVVLVLGCETVRFTSKPGSRFAYYTNSRGEFGRVAAKAAKAEEAMLRSQGWGPVAHAA